VTVANAGWLDRLRLKRSDIRTDSGVGPKTGAPHRSPLQRWPIYPAALAAAAMLGLLANTTASFEAAPRPLLFALLFTAVLQLVLSIVLRSRLVGAYVAASVTLSMLGWPIIAAVLVAIPLSSAAAAWVARRGRSVFSWQRATEFLNLASVITLVLASGTAWSSGTFASASRPAMSAVPVETAPDIYLILLDGHPRGDTMEEDFGLDSQVFLGELERMGFDVSKEARSNYNLTALTLASMFNMQQISSIAGLDPKQSPVDQQRRLAEAFNEGTALDEMRRLGYEIITVSPPIESVTLYAADDIVDNGSITEFELSVLQSGITPLLLPDAQRAVVMHSLRGRVLDSLDTTVEIAKGDRVHPRLVFTHVMSPHVPVLFAADGSSVDGWPCYPKCSAGDFGWRYGSDAIEPLAGQIEYLDSLVVETVKGVLANSPEPPIIIVFSDHGGRHDLSDRGEMLRTLLVAFTPGTDDVFPADATLVNLFPRLLNAYFDSGLALASDEGYTIDMTQLHTIGPLSLEPM
jgi:hypothetical protein